MCSTRQCYEQQYQQIQERPFKNAFDMDKSDLQLAVLIVILIAIGIAFCAYEAKK